jgi:hypothetical protein
MATQTVRHCTSCHPFTADVPALATRDSARGTLVPGETQCLGCHAMQRVLATFSSRKDPHGGKCGTCHDPHTQRTPAQATSCGAAGCHADWRDDPFHAGENHRRVGAQCTTCHIPHESRIDASDCAGCHVRVRSGGRLRPPVPFDTAAALRRSMPPADVAPPAIPPFGASFNAVHPRPRRSHLTGSGRGDAIAPESDTMPVSQDAGVRPMRPPAPLADTFPHSRHTSVACLECHKTGSLHGRLNFERPRGCALCHHQAPSSARCVSCHRPEQFGSAKHMTVTVTVPDRAARPRTVDFLHSRHVSRECTECHTTPVTLAPGPDKVQCVSCHAEHHAADRDCTACHRIADPTIEHRPVEAAHQRCDACHTASSVARLTPTRTFCITCHAKQATGHNEATECTVCHFLAEPAEYRARLRTPPTP